MNKENLHGLGSIILLLSMMYFYLANGHPLQHHSTIIYIMFFVGLIMTNKAFDDALVPGNE